MKIISFFISTILILLDVYLLFILPFKLINGIIISAIGGLGIGLIAYSIQDEKEKTA